jgi:GTP-binding protein Era
LFVVDSSVEAGGGDRYIVDLLNQYQVPVILGLNKADQQQDRHKAEGTRQKAQGRRAEDGEQRTESGISPSYPPLPIPPSFPSPLDQTYLDLAQTHGWAVAKFSALTGEGLEHLQQVLIDHLEPGPYYYPPDLVTDQPERFIMGELIREQILLLTREEVPHSVAVVIDRVEEEPTITRVLATVFVERPSQKGILIGKGGGMLKEIGTSAREQMQKLIAGKVYLELFVKVEPRWRQSRARLTEFGYRIEK